MGKFDIDGFRQALEEFRSLKQKYPKYDYREWRIDKNDRKCPASRCADVMAKVKAALEGVREEWGFADATVHCSAGSGYYPDVPWIGIMFGEEKPTNGVYPALGFHRDGLIVSCTESFVNPQVDFSNDCYTAEEIEKQKTDDGKGDSPHVNEHMAKGAVTWFPYGDEKAMAEGNIETALRLAIKKHHDYRQAHKHRRKPWYKVERIGNVEKWIRKLSKDCGNWIFRGQADSEWRLETGIGRIIFASDSEATSYDDARVRDGERSSMELFYREIARKVEYASFRNVELLALMQHYGSKTRLLDFSFSPLVALYIAMESHDEYMGHVDAFRTYHGDGSSAKKPSAVISVWAVNMKMIAPPKRGHIDALLKDGNGADDLKDEPYITRRESLELFHQEAEAILNVKTSDRIRAGVDIVIPRVNNDRSSAQEGLFLMPRRMDQSFEANLSRSIASKRKKRDACLIRYDFPTEKKEEIREYLERHRITAKQIYPDLTGLAKSLNADICSGVRK